MASRSKKKRACPYEECQLSKEIDRKCPYEVCLLPVSDRMWVLRLFIVFACWGLLVATKFTYIGLIMFVVPHLLDVASYKHKITVVICIQAIYFIVDAFALLVGTFEAFGVLTNNGIVYQFKESGTILSEIIIPLGFIQWSLAINILLPIVLHLGTPSKETEEPRVNLKKQYTDLKT